MRQATSRASSDRASAEAEALPGLVELDRERPVHVEVAGLDRQVVRLERAAALLVDDVEGADEPDVVDEVGEVAGPPAAVEVAHEGRAADGPEDEVRAAEGDVPLGVPGVQIELGRSSRDQRLDVVGIEPDAPVGAVDGRAGARERIERPVAEHLDTDLGQDPQRRPMDRLDLVRRQDLDRPERVRQPPPRELLQTGRGATRPPTRTVMRLRRGSVTGVGDLVHERMLRRVRPARRHVLRGAVPSGRFLMAVSDGRRSMTSRSALPAALDPSGRPRETDMKLKVLAIVALAAIGVGAAFVAVGGLPASAASTTQYLTGPATTGDVADDVAATGTVATSASYGLTFGTQAHLAGADAPAGSTTWTVTDLTVAVGDTVKKGDVLATADTTDLKRQLADANTAVDTARIQLRDWRRPVSRTPRTPTSPRRSARPRSRSTTPGRSSPTPISTRDDLKTQITPGHPDRARSTAS